MNAQRRNALAKIIKRINGIDFSAILLKVESIRDDLEALKDEEQDYYDNMSESLQSGDKGDRVQEVLDSLDEASNSLADLRSTLDALDFGEITSAIEAASEDRR